MCIATKFVFCAYVVKALKRIVLLLNVHCKMGCFLLGLYKLFKEVDEATSEFVLQ